VDEFSQVLLTHNEMKVWKQLLRMVHGEGGEEQEASLYDGGLVRLRWELHITSFLRFTSILTKIIKYSHEKPVKNLVVG